REPPGAADIEDGLPRPAVRIRVQLEKAPVRLQIGGEIRQMAIMVTPGKEHLAKRLKHTWLVLAEVVRENQAQGSANFGLIVVVPLRIVPASAVDHLFCR